MGRVSLLSSLKNASLSFGSYEKFVPVEPTLPYKILNNRTSFFGYLQTYIHGIILLLIVYYLPYVTRGLRLQQDN